jgi:hypothetical protein
MQNCRKSHILAFLLHCIAPLLPCMCAVLVRHDVVVVNEVNLQAMPQYCVSKWIVGILVPLEWWYRVSDLKTKLPVALEHTVGTTYRIFRIYSAAERLGCEISYNFACLFQSREVADN